MRAPYQVLVFPFIKDSSGIKFAIFKRRDDESWQAIAGGGENDESIVEAAKREAWEEAGISFNSKYLKLDSTTSIPVEPVFGKFLWGNDVYVIPEYSFGIRVFDPQLVLSNEHTEYRWVVYDEAIALLKWDSNKTALWELKTRLSK